MRAQRLRGELVNALSGSLLTRLWRSFKDLDSNFGIDQKDDSELEKDVAAEASINQGDEDPSAARAAFIDTFMAMDKGCTWLLAASGRTVEGVIFEACRVMDDELFANSLAQSFVIDVTDPIMKGWFETAEWDEIQSYVLPLPQPDVLMIESMRRFLCVGHLYIISPPPR